MRRRTCRDLATSRSAAALTGRAYHHPGECGTGSGVNAAPSPPSGDPAGDPSVLLLLLPLSGFWARGGGLGAEVERPAALKRAANAPRFWRPVAPSLSLWWVVGGGCVRTVRCIVTNGMYCMTQFAALDRLLVVCV
jgi:hypothetical protein